VICDPVMHDPFGYKFDPAAHPPVQAVPVAEQAVTAPAEETV